MGLYLYYNWIYLLVILKDWTIRYNISKWSLTTLWNSCKTVSDGVSSSTTFQVVRGAFRNPAICDMKLFATMLHGCKIWIWMLDVAGVVNRLVQLFSFWPFKLQNKFYNNNKKNLSYSLIKIYWCDLLQAQH